MHKGDNFLPEIKKQIENVILEDSLEKEQINDKFEDNLEEKRLENNIYENLSEENKEQDMIHLFINTNLCENIKNELKEIDDAYIDHIGFENVVKEILQNNLDILEGLSDLGIESVAEVHNNQEENSVVVYPGFKELLKKVGFSVLGAQNFEDFIDPTVKHCSIQNWFDLYLDQIFQNTKDLIACSGFPFEGPVNTQFSVNSYIRPISNSSTHQTKEIVAWNLLDSDIDILNTILDNRSVLSQGNEIWYHGTNGNSAKNIITNGINPKKGRPKKDFSHNDGFYLQKSFEKAKEWGKLQSKKTDIYAVLIYKIPEHGLSNYKHSSLPELNSNNKEKWNEVVKYFRSGLCTTKPSWLPLYDIDIHFIQGLIGKYDRETKSYIQNIEGEVQICSKSQDMGWFLNESLIEVVFFSK